MKRNEWFENIFITLSVPVVLLCTGLLASTASAQTSAPEPSTKGFSVGGHVAIMGIHPDSINVNGQHVDLESVSTTGGGGTFAYGVNDWLTIVLNGDGHEADEDRHLAFADIGAQFFLPGRRSFRPHLDVAMTGRRAEFETTTGTVDARGSSLTVGGGVLYFVSRPVALDATLLATNGGLHQYVDGKRLEDRHAIDVSAIRFLVGIRWYPGRR